MKNKILIAAYSIGAGDNSVLILLKKTGVFYTAQCDGVCCSHPEVEGYALNMGSFVQDFNTCQFGCYIISQDEICQTALGKAFDEYAANNYCFLDIKFDWSRLGETKEGWIPVLVSGKPDEFHDYTLTDAPAILHNGNCD